MRQTRTKIKILVTISTLIIVGIWTSWLIIYKPYSQNNSKENNIELFPSLKKTTEEIQSDAKKSKEQWELLQKFFENQIQTKIATTTASSTERKEVSVDTKAMTDKEKIVDVMRDLLINSSTTTTTIPAL